MKRRSVLDNAPTGTRVNVTPMIDVVMCLIVFYLMVGQLALNRSSGVRIPATEAGTAATSSTGDPMVLGVRPDGSLLIDGESIDASRLAGELRGRVARRPGLRVEVRADRDVRFGAVRPVLAAARDAGIESVEMVTERGG